MATRVNPIVTRLRYSSFSTINESHILNQLSDLLPFINNNNNNQFLENDQIQTKVKVSDNKFISPEDKQFSLYLQNYQINTRFTDIHAFEDKRFNHYLETETVEPRDRAANDLLLPEDKRSFFYWETEKIETRDRVADELLLPEDKRSILYSETEKIEGGYRSTDELLLPEDKRSNLYSETEKIEGGYRSTDELLLPEDKRSNLYSETEWVRAAEDKRLDLYSEMEKIEIRVRAADEFLSPEDKLRGVFLQKIRGKSAIENALSNVGVELSVETLAKVVDRGNLGGEAMVMFFNWAVKQPGIDKNDICCYHVVLKALGRRKLFDHMMGVMRGMTVNGIRPDLITIEIVMDSFIRVNHVSKAIQIFGNLEEIGLTCDIESLNVLVGCLCKRSHVGAANALVSRMKGKIVVNKATYDCIISGWSKMGKISEMETNLREMITCGFEPDCLTFGYLIEGLGRAGKIGDAVKVFEGMSERGCVPDARVYSAMILNFVSVGDFDKAVENYRVMVKNKCEPNMETYFGLISGFLKARKVADVIELFDEMLARGLVPSPGTVTSFVEPLCSYGPPHAALMIYKKATKVGVKVTFSAYKLLLMRLSRFGKCGMLLNIWDEMQKSGYSSDVEVYEYIINGLCNVGQLDNAVLVMEESIRKGFCPSKLICSKLNHKLMSSEKVASAYKLFLKVRNARRGENERRVWRARGWHF